MPAINHIWLIRHGETPWSLSGQHTGKTEMELTPVGQAMAKAVGHALGGHKFAMVLTSPRIRARETCRLSGYGGSAIIEENLQEWDYGGYEGRKSVEIKAEIPGWSLWRDGVRDGESLASVGSRADQVIRRAMDCEGDVAMFAHGHILRVLGARWLGLPPDGGKYFALDAGTISILGFEHQRPVITQWNMIPPRSL